MPYQTPPLPLERPAAPPDPNGSVGPTMTLRQALAASTASCAFRRVELDDKHLHTDVIIVQCKPPHDWWVYDYRPADGVFTGWQMRD